MAGPFFVGIVTYALPDAVDLMGPQYPPSNYKKQDVIDKWFDERRQELLTRAPDVVSTGWVGEIDVVGPDGEPVLNTAGTTPGYAASKFIQWYNAIVNSDARHPKFWGFEIRQNMRVLVMDALLHGPALRAEKGLGYGIDLDEMPMDLLDMHESRYRDPYHMVASAEDRKLLDFKTLCGRLKVEPADELGRYAYNFCRSIGVRY